MEEESFISQNQKKRENNKTLYKVESLTAGLDFWAVSEAIERMVEGTHVVFLRNITGKRVWITTGDTW